MFSLTYCPGALVLSLWLHCSASGAEGTLGLCCSLLAARVEHGAVPSPHRQPQESSAAGGSQPHSCLGMRAQSPGDGHFRHQDAEAWLCRSQVLWENTPVTITSSKNCQTSLGSLFQLNTLPRRAVRDQTTHSLLPTLTSRKDKINCF